MSDDYIPDGHISIFAAIDRQGRVHFGADWTGSEATRWPSEFPAFHRAYDRALSSYFGATLRKRVKDHDEAMALYIRERSAWERFQAARTDLRKLLGDGGLSSAFLDSGNGALIVVGPSFWRRDVGANALRFNQSHDFNGLRGRFFIVAHEVKASVGPESTLPAALMPIPRVRPTAPRKGGRPSASREIMKEHARRIASGAALRPDKCEAEYLIDWATKQGLSDVPIIKTVRGHISQHRRDHKS